MFKLTKKQKIFIFFLFLLSLTVTLLISKINHDNAQEREKEEEEIQNTPKYKTGSSADDNKGHNQSYDEYEKWKEETGKTYDEFNKQEKNQGELAVQLAEIEFKKKYGQINKDSHFYAESHKDETYIVTLINSSSKEKTTAILSYKVDLSKNKAEEIDLSEEQ